MTNVAISWLDVAIRRNWDTEEEKKIGGKGGVNKLGFFGLLLLCCKFDENVKDKFFITSSLCGKYRTHCPRFWLQFVIYTMHSIV